MINTVWQLMHNIRLFWGTEAPLLHRGGKPELKFCSYHRWSRYRSCGKRVIPTARKPWLCLLSQFRSKRHITCIECERATLPILNHMPQTFSLLPVFRPVLSKGASKAKIVCKNTIILPGPQTSVCRISCKSIYFYCIAPP